MSQRHHGDNQAWIAAALGVAGDGCECWRWGRKSAGAIAARVTLTRETVHRFEIDAKAFGQHRAKTGGDLIMSNFAVGFHDAHCVFNSNHRQYLASQA